MWLHALAECPNNAEVFYHSCKFLMAQEKSSAVAPLFRGFILSLCEDEQSQKKPVDVLRNILGFSSEELLRSPVVKKDLQEQLNQQTPYLHLIHCCWQWLHGSVEQTMDAFERALGSPLQLEELHTLWLDYLTFSCSQQSRAPSRQFSHLVHRCLSTVPSRLELPFNPAEFWNCYRFHNQVSEPLSSRCFQTCTELWRFSSFSGGGVCVRKCDQSRRLSRGVTMSKWGG
nr:PREDICTED: zinc finger C3H1 domain-containing protein-like [Paralichthys olivaceus]